MQFLTSLIGGSGNTLLNAALALGIVLLLIVLAMWILRLVMNASNNVVRGGSRRRLAVVDTLQVDGKRQLVIIRRDNVEHLILTGGPQDVLIEGGIAAEGQPLVSRPIAGGRRTGSPQPNVQQPAQPMPQMPPQLQRAPVPQRAAPLEAVSPVPSNDMVPPRSPLERLRELGRGGQRRSASLRHTGLMRPVSRMEPGLIPANSDNSVQLHTDSATTGRVMPFNAGAREGDGQTFGDNDSAHRDERY